ncbi:MAG: DUF2723 domain-containing protein [Chrysiogenia bacterium]
MDKIDFRPILKVSLLMLFFLGIPLLYFSFLPASYSFDGTVFSQMLRYALLKHDWLAVVQAHHLLYFPVNFLIYRILQAVFHYQVLEFFHLQLFSMTFAVMTLAVVWRLLKKIGLTWGLRLLGVTAVAFAHAFWFYAVDAEGHVPGVFFVASGLYLLVSREPRTRQLIGAAFCLSVAAGFHLTNLLIAVTVFFYFLYKRLSWKRFGQFFLAWAGFMLTMYGAYAALAHKPVLRILADMLFGSDVYSGYHSGYLQFWSRSTLVASFTAMKTALVAGPGVLAWIVFGGFFLLLIMAGKRSDTEEKRSFKRAMLFWSLPFLLFFSFWDPGNMEFKIHALVPLLLIAIVSLSRLKPLAGHLAGISLVSSLLLINLFSGIMPQSAIEKNTNYQVAAAIRRSTPLNAQVLITGRFEGYGHGKIYIPYFAGREVLILDWLLGKGHSLHVIDAQLRKRIASGQPVYTLDEIALGGKALKILLEFHHIRETDFERLAAAMRFIPIAKLPGGDHLYRLEFRSR